MKFLALVLLSLAPLLAADEDETPKPYEALIAFQKLRDGDKVMLRVHEIGEALLFNRNLVYQSYSNSGHGEIATFIIFSRVPYPHQESFQTVKERIYQVIASADFQPYFDQLNGLQSDQASQSIWLLSQDDLTLLIEVIPKNFIAISLFHSADFRNTRAKLRKYRMRQYFRFNPSPQ